MSYTLGIVGAGQGAAMGMTVTAVKKLQQALLAKGYDPQGIDGQFGVNTAMVLQRYLLKYGNLSGLGAEVAQYESTYVALANQLRKTSTAITLIQPTTPAAGGGAQTSSASMFGNPLVLGGLALTGVGLFYFLVIRKKGKKGKK